MKVGLTMYLLIHRQETSNIRALVSGGGHSNLLSTRIPNSPVSAVCNSPDGNLTLNTFLILNHVDSLPWSRKVQF